LKVTDTSEIGNNHLERSPSTTGIPLPTTRVEPFKIDGGGGGGVVVEEEEEEVSANRR
jgi:hypothetical protein